MDIKGIGNFDNNLKKVSSKEKKLPSKSSNLQKTSSSEKIDINETSLNIKVKNLMKEMKTFQNQVSEQQSYLSNLHLARKKLTGNRNLMELFNELTGLRNKAHFNSKPLMNNIIPDGKQFYQSYDNIKVIKNKVENEIERTKQNLGKSQNQLSRFSISIENIRASLNSKDIQEMQTIFNKRMLYKNFNKNLVISLMS